VYYGWITKNKYDDTKSRSAQRKGRGDKEVSEETVIKIVEEPKEGKPPVEPPKKEEVKEPPREEPKEREKILISEISSYRTKYKDAPLSKLTRKAIELSDDGLEKTMEFKVVMSILDEKLEKVEKK